MFTNIAILCYNIYSKDSYKFQTLTKGGITMNCDWLMDDRLEREISGVYTKKPLKEASTDPEESKSEEPTE